MISSTSSSVQQRPHFPVSAQLPAAPTLSISPHHHHQQQQHYYSSSSSSTSSNNGDPFESFPSPQMRSWLQPTLHSSSSSKQLASQPRSTFSNSTITRPRKGIFIHPDDLDLDLSDDEEEAGRGRSFVDQAQFQQCAMPSRRGRSPAAGRR